MKLLIVEDEAVTALHLTMEFSKLGYSVSSVARGEDALLHLEKEIPDAVLMDINLAGRLDGIETAKALRVRGAHRVVFMSGYDRRDLEKRVHSDYDSGARLFPKPIQATDIKKLDQVFKKNL